VVPGITVYPRGGRFSYNVTADPDPVTGQRVREYGGGFLEEEEAWAEAIKAKAELEQNRRVTPARRTVSDFFAEWLDSLQGSLKPSAYAGYVVYTTAHVVPGLGKRRLQEIDVPILNAFYRRLLDHGRIRPDRNLQMYAYWLRRKEQGKEPSPREIAAACGTTIHAARSAGVRFRRGRVPVAMSSGLAPKTVRNIHLMMHRALSDAVSWGYLPQNPAAYARLPRSPRGEKNRPRPWSVEELMTWLAVARQDRDAALWVLLTTTGMRRSELAGLHRDSLQLDQGLLRIEPTRVVVAGRAQASDGKTESSRRTITLDDVTIAALREHLAMLDEERRFFGRDYQDAGLLICHPDGRPLNPGTITHRFNRLVDRAGVRRIRLHDVRH
jgi:integrase